jgi:hypothetical protein
LATIDCVEEQWHPQRRDGEDGLPVVDFGWDIVVPDERDFPVKDGALPYFVNLHYAFDGDRFEVTSATYEQRPGGSAVRREVVAKVSPERLLRDHLGQYLPPKRRRKVLVTSSRLVAVYRAAWACHVPPTKAVATVFNLTSGAAEQRVFTVRAEGLLPATDSGKARG